MLAMEMPRIKMSDLYYHVKVNLAEDAIFKRHFMYDNRWTYLLLQFSVPLSFLIVLRCFILDILRELKHKRGKICKCASSNTEAKMVLGVVLVFVLLETPGVWTEDDGNPTDLAPFINLRILSCLNSSVNFFVFCLSGRRFRTKIRAVFTQCTQD
jgi:hypothetical protein